MIRWILTLLLGASVVVALLLIRYASKRRSMPGARFFIRLLAITLLSNMAYAAEINATALTGALVWFYLQHLFIPFQHYFWMMMSLEYAKAPKGLIHRVKWIGLLHPLAFYMIFFTNHLHQRYIEAYQFVDNGYFFVIVSEKGPLYMLMVASGTAIGILSMTAYIFGLTHTSKRHQGGYVIMMVASLIPWVTVYLIAGNVNYLGIDYFPVVSVVSGILYMLGIFKFRMFHTIPIATELVFRRSNEGVMIIDLAEHIIDANDAMLKLYPTLAYRRSSYTLKALMQDYPELKPIEAQQATFAYSVKETEVEIYYQAVVTAITTEEGLQIGKLVTISDITLFMEEQIRLKTLATTAMAQAETNELSFLQAQIKPHFMNNTLSVIGSMITRSPMEAKALIADLGAHLANCYYFDSTAYMVPLEQELESVHTYVKIEKARFRERLNFHLVCEALPELMVPRLVLQPLVENALKHGILKKAHEGHVWLKITTKQGFAQFEIQDDGVGMSKEKVESLLHSQENLRSIGLSNIQKRLLMHYGEGLIMSSNLDVGTTVRFKIPLDTQKER